MDETTPRVRMVINNPDNQPLDEDMIQFTQFGMLLIQKMLPLFTEDTGEHAPWLPQDAFGKACLYLGADIAACCLSQSTDPDAAVEAFTEYLRHVIAAQLENVEAYRTGTRH